MDDILHNMVEQIWYLPRRIFPAVLSRKNSISSLSFLLSFSKEFKSFFFFLQKKSLTLKSDYFELCLFELANEKLHVNEDQRNNENRDKI